MNTYFKASIFCLMAHYILLMIQEIELLEIQTFMRIYRLEN